jgi:hypothetical protein
MTNPHRLLAPVVALTSLTAIADVGVFLSDETTLVFTDVKEFNSGPIFGRQGLAVSNIGRYGGDGWGEPNDWLYGSGGIGMGVIGEYDGFGPEVGSGWRFSGKSEGELRDPGFFIGSSVIDLTLGFTNLTNGQSSYLLTAELSSVSTTAAWRGDPGDIGVFSAQVMLRTRWPDGGGDAHWYDQRHFTAPFDEQVVTHDPWVFQLEVPAGPPEYELNRAEIEIRILYTKYVQAVPSPGGVVALAVGFALLNPRRRARAAWSWARSAGI